MLPKVVLDTNVIVSSIIANGKPNKLLRLGIDGRFIIIMSKELLQELISVLRRPKFKITKMEIRDIVSLLIRSSETIAVKSKFKVVREDPEDDIVVNTAIDGKANYIISGDEHLIAISKFKGIEILTVDQMLKILEI